MSANKQRGTRFESAVVEFLRASGFRYAERRALAGARDLGDVTGIPGVVIECKSQNRQSLAEWWDEAQQEKANDQADTACVWFKRRGKASAGDAYVLMDGHTYVQLLTAAGFAASTTVRNGVVESD